MTTRSPHTVFEKPQPIAISDYYKSLYTLPVREFRSDHVGAVNCLSIDQQHFRYLLSAGADSSIKLWDLGEQQQTSSDYEDDFEEEEVYDDENNDNIVINNGNINYGVSDDTNDGSNQTIHHTHRHSDSDSHDNKPTNRDNSCSNSVHEIVNHDIDNNNSSPLNSSSSFITNSYNEAESRTTTTLNNEDSHSHSHSPHCITSPKKGPFSEGIPTPTSTISNPPLAKRIPKNHHTLLLSEIKTKKKRFPKIAEVQRKSHHKFGVSCIQWYPRDAGLFVSSSFDHYVKVWDSENLEPVYDFDLSHRVYSVDLSQTGDHSLIATATDHPLIRLLDLRTTSSSHTLKGHRMGSVQSVKWSPVKPYILASGGSDGTIRIWDIRQSHSCIDVLDVHKTSCDNATSIGRPSSSFSRTSKIPANKKIISHRGSVNSLLWLPSGHHLISSGTDDEIKLWEFPNSSTTETTSSTSSSVSSSKYLHGFNTLVNYGRLVSNRFPQTMYMCLTSDSVPIIQTVSDFYNDDYDDQYDDDDNLDNLTSLAGACPLFFFPSDSGQIIVYESLSGKLINRLSRPANYSGVIPSSSSLDSNNGISNDSGSSFTLNIPRSTCIAARGGFGDQTNVPFEYFSGAMDGSITRWFVPPPPSNNSNNNNNNSSMKNRRNKRRKIIRNSEQEHFGNDDFDSININTHNQLGNLTRKDNDDENITVIENSDSDEDSDNNYESIGNVLDQLKK